jgi:hypothetical protein
LSTIGLPGGSEEQALSIGFALEQGRAEGFTRATANVTQAMTRLVERSNQLLVQDSTNAYIVLQPDLNGPFARSVNISTLRNEFAGDLIMGGLPDNLTDDQFRHQLDAKMNLVRGQSVFKGIPGDHNYRPVDPVTGKVSSIYIARTAQAKNALPTTFAPLRIKL